MSTSFMKVLVVGAVLFGLAIPTFAQETTSFSAALSNYQATSHQSSASLSTDWTHKHVIFSAPSDPDVAEKVQKNPRYWQQQIRRMGPRAADLERGESQAVEVLSDAGTDANSGKKKNRKKVKTKRFNRKRDWSESVATSALTLNPNKGVTYPAKFAFDTSNPTPNCLNDYAVFTLNQHNSSSFNIIGYNNLYVNGDGSGLCNSALVTAPTALFAYFASTAGGQLQTAPVLSLDGTEIAFIEDSSSSQFHVLRWKAGNVNSTFASPFNATTLASCVTTSDVPPCEYTVQFSSHNADISAPYVDYGTDTAYVSDNNGAVSAISPVFTATHSNPPAIVSGFPLSPSGSTMSPPVYDSISGNLFVGDQGGNLFYIRTANSTKGTCVSGSPPCVGKSSLSGTAALNVSSKDILDAPIVDSSNQTVYVFSNSDPGNTNSAALQTDTTLSFLNEAKAGSNGGGQNVFSGDFTDPYFTSPSTGLLYVCGNAGSNPELFAISFGGAGCTAAGSPISCCTGNGTGNCMTTGTASFGPLDLSNASTSTQCSPITENFNSDTGKDQIYVGVVACAGFGGIASTVGCIQAWDVTSGFPASDTPAAIAPESFGTSGIITDNTSSQSAAKVNTNIYFLTQGAQSCPDYNGTTQTGGNCAVKLTQSGLK
jgi:hypothetical protein